MSIASAFSIDWWTVAGGVWLLTVVVIALRTGWWRPRPALSNGLSELASPEETWRQVPQLAVAALVSFVAWVGAQLVYLVVRHPAMNPGSGEVSWSAADLTRLSLIAPAVGWCVGFGLLVAGGGTAAVGYGRRRFPAGMLGGVLGLLAALPVVYAVLQITLATLAYFGIEHPPKHELLQVLDSGADPMIRIGAGLAAVVAAPLFEELLFRGLIQGGLRRATRSPWLSILLASTLFASIHPKWTIPPIFVFSLLLGIVYERSRNLWATTMMHALFNAIAIISS